MHIAQQAGTICYGSSPICAYKIFSAIASGLFCLETVANGGFVHHRDGIIHQELRSTLNNLHKYALAVNDEIVTGIVKEYEYRANKKG